MKKKLVVIISVPFLLLVCLYFVLNQKKDNLKIEKVAEKHIRSYGYRTDVPTLSFRQIYNDPILVHLNMFETPGRFGVEHDDAKVLRALRFKNVTDAVEDRYNLPRNVILAMVIKESNGIDLLPNGLGDGGFGLCHMQPLLAVEFGLRTFKNCNSMVCNGKDKRSCTRFGIKLNHAKDLKDLIESKSFNRKLLISYDDRLHPILNLDAVGRMLSCYMDGKPIKGLGPLRTAVCRYAGSHNYEKYWSKVLYYVDLLEDKDFMSKLESKFNNLNQKLLIDGKPANFDSYLSVFQKQNYNYGLEEYRKLPKMTPKNSEEVKKTYRNFIK